MSAIKRFITGAASVSMINVLRLAVQFLSLPLLARMLSPNEYGLVGMAMPFILFVMMIADSGLASSLVRDRSGDIAAWHSCFWLTAFLGVLLCLLLLLVSPAIALWLHEPALGPITATLSVVILMQSLTLIPGALLQQGGYFIRISAAEIASLVASVGVVLWCAFHGMGAWALVWQQVALYAVRLVATLALSPYRPRLTFKWQLARDHVLFGWKLLFANVVNFASKSAESLLIGKIRGPSDLGIFGMAIQFARLPFMVVTGPLQYVLYPSISADRDNRDKLRAQLLLATKGLAILLLAPMALVGAASDPIFDLLLSDKWSESATVFALIVPAAAFQPVVSLVGTFILAIGRPDVQLRLASQSMILWVLCLLGSVWFGLSVVAISYTVFTLLFSAWTLRVMLPLLDCRLRDYLNAVGAQIVLALVAASIYRLLLAQWPLSDLAAISLAIAMAAICVAGSVIVDRKQLILAVSNLRAT